MILRASKRAIAANYPEASSGAGDRSTATLWSLYPGPQTQAAESEAYETLYGGAAGGGKSGLLLILATRYHRRSIIFRRKYPNLKEMIQNSKDLLESIAHYNGTEKLWRDIPGSRTLEFGALQYEDNKFDYRGRAHDLKAWDELTEFTESQYLFVNGWCRSAIPDQRTRIVATCNPPTRIEERWIVKRWAPWLDPKHPNPAVPGELRWFARIDGVDTEVESSEPFEHEGKTIYPRSRTFFPARLDDNPALRDTDYRATLDNLPEPLRSQLLYGDFSIQEEDDPWQVIPTPWIRAAQARWEEKPRGAQSCVGVDVSRGGKDKTTIAPRYGLWIGRLSVYEGNITNDGHRVAEFVLQSLQYPDCPIHIDVVGVGASPYDTLKRGKAIVHGLSGGERSGKTDRAGVLGFSNKRSEWWWNLRELLDPIHGVPVALPPDEELLIDLATPRWSVSMLSDPKRKMLGLIQVESKDDIRRRLPGGRSPDRGDAVVYAFADTRERYNKTGWLDLL